MADAQAIANNTSAVIGKQKNDQDYAVVIGVNDYMTLQGLNGPKGDAENFMKWLLREDGGNLPKDNCKIVLSDPTQQPYRPIIDDIDDAIHEIYLSGQATGYRRLYFYFSGHGLGAKWDVNGLCLPKWSDFFRRAALSSKEYFDVFIESDLFDEVYFFLDCCRDRKINALPLPPTIGWPRPGGGKSMGLVMFASEFETPAFEGLAATDGNMTVNGFFSRALLDGLNGGAANSKGEITVERLLDFVKDATEKYAKDQQLKQTASSVIKPGSAKSMSDPLFTVPVTDPKLTITFQSSGWAKLTGPDLKVLQEGQVNVGDVWQRTLPKGTFYLIEMDGKTEPIIVDGSKNTIFYDFPKPI